jgi:2-hydroxy-6-oxo-octa-2,4-dienoate hydrolase
MATSTIDTTVTTSTRIAAGVPTRVHEAGAGRALVLLHGSGPGVSAWANWSGVFPDLAADHRVVAPDLAGFGGSVGAPGTRYDMKLWVAQLVGLLDALGLVTATLVGNSFGGGLALAATLRHPDRIDGLVLMGTPAGEFAMTEGLRAGWYYEPDRDEMARILRLFPHDPSIVTQAMVQERYEASARPGAQDAFRKLIPEPGPDGAVVRGVPESSLRTISTPALVLHGREDAVIPVALGYRLLECLPHAEMHVFGGCGHWVHAERPDRFVELVRGFTRGLS